MIRASRHTQHTNPPKPIPCLHTHPSLSHLVDLSIFSCLPNKQSTSLQRNSLSNPSFPFPLSSSSSSFSRCSSFLSSPSIPRSLPTTFSALTTASTATPIPHPLPRYPFLQFLQFLRFPRFRRPLQSLQCTFPSIPTCKTVFVRHFHHFLHLTGTRFPRFPQFLRRGNASGWIFR